MLKAASTIVSKATAVEQIFHIAGGYYSTISYMLCWQVLGDLFSVVSIMLQYLFHMSTFQELKWMAMKPPMDVWSKASQNDLLPHDFFFTRMEAIK